MSDRIQALRPHRRAAEPATDGRADVPPAAPVGDGAVDDAATATPDSGPSYAVATATVGDTTVGDTTVGDTTVGDTTVGDTTVGDIASVADSDVPAAAARPAKAPVYWRLLRLRHIHPNGWQRAILVEGVIGVAITLVLADVASAWTLLALPAASIAVVKGHDLLTGLLRGDPQTRTAPPPRG